MNYLQKSILKTIAYWDVLDWPLTSFEVWKYLVNPRRLALNAPDHITLGEIEEALSSKELSKYVTQKSGFYFLRDRDDSLVPGRISRDLLADMKWKIVKRRIKWLQMIPYIRLVMGSGSLAAGNVNDASDLDLLIVTGAGRIWTARILATLLFDVFRWRRKSDTDTKDKFCLNHYITSDSLLIDIPSLYTAQLYARLMPIFGSWMIFRSFQERNTWIRSYIPNYQMPFIPHKKSVAQSRLLSAIARSIERVLDAKLGDWLEKRLSEIQSRKIKSNPRTSAPGGRIRYSDEGLEFHPDSKEAAIISRLNERLKALGFPELADEKDSGLT